MRIYNGELLPSKIDKQLVPSFMGKVHHWRHFFRPFPIPIPISGNIPSLKEFTEYTKTLEDYIPALDDLIKAKYDSWFKNGWKNGYNKPITNWKSSIKNGMAFLQSELQSSSNISSKIALQTIKRPTSKFDE